MQSNKAAFLRHPDPDIFIRTEKKKRSWLRHSVALLVLAPRADHIALVLPAKVANRGDVYVRVPPQQTLSRSGTVLETAHVIAGELFVRQVPFGNLTYLGSTRGNTHRAGKIEPYGKYIHWVGVQLTSTKAAFVKDSERFQEPFWCSANHLLEMDTFAMSERKYTMILQAITAFAEIKRIEGQLTKRAQQRLHVV